MKVIAFVCHGSICRSPAAENIFNYLIKKKHLDKEYVATSYALTSEEIGNDIYPPMKEALRNANIPFIKHSSKRLTIKDINKVDIIYYMDKSNESIINFHFKEYLNKFKMINIYNNDIPYIEDPWYTDKFTLVVNQIYKCVSAIIDNL